MGNLWDKRPDETSLQYTAFECYMMLDPRVRSLGNAWARFTEINESAKGKDPSSAFRYWCSKFEWVQRAEAYDAYLASKRRKGYEDGVVKEARRQAVSVEKLRGQMAENFDTIQNTLELLMGKVPEIDPDKITLAGISNLQRVQLDIARFLSDDSAGKTPEEELDKMTEDQLAKKLFGEAKSGGAKEGS